MPRSNDVMQSSMRSPSRRPNTTAENMHERTSPGLLRSNESSRHWRDPSSRTDMSGNSSGNHHRPHLSKVTDHPRTSDLSLDSVANLSLSLNPEEGSAAPYHSKYDWRLHSLTLCRHIFTQGLLEGIGSDIIVHVPAWEKTYQLHRLVLDQNPYFRLLLHGGFRETSSDSIVLNFEKNQYITAESFYFVLTRLYGKLFDPDITQENVRQILATCSFFQLQHMCDLCVDYILKILDEHNFMEYLTFCDEILVHSSDRICDAIFTYLCREVYTMDRKKVAAVPVRWLKKVIESDAFWVPSEYERYQFAYQVLTIYYKHYCANGTPEDHKGTALDGDQKDDGGSTSECTTVVTNPDEQVLVTRSVSTDTADGLQKRSSFAPSPLTTDPTVSDEEKTDETENTDDEAESIEPFSLKDLEIYNEMLCQSIHYIHMTFEQLESIGKDINPFTNERVVPEHVLKDALWHQIQMRTKIESASERHSELGLIVSPSAEDKTNSRSTKCNADTSSVTKKDIFYLIPADDTTTYTGESALSWTTSATSFESKCSDAAKPGVEKDEGCTGRATTDQYTIYPPFRFSVEFSDISTLRHGVRVYSKTVFYAGYVKQRQGCESDAVF
ncbi:hypothetical protein DFQ28_001996 [Apophysomyces sp. BC1034]|nr:hypothetical protein DFQ30_002348 [Apophysomyces sp. BC1015]KAG0179930.1 hypothetical protein DFQ29_001474 [Apophysomyces sp. BC1021]KAG0190484.1 hypothetical protein DFQ28_001996 [Apophysomyces sp. BC1034]